VKSTYTNKEALPLLIQGEKLTKVRWARSVFIYVDSFGKIRISNGHEEYNWNKCIKSDNEKRWMKFQDFKEVK